MEKHIRNRVKQTNTVERTIGNETVNHIKYETAAKSV